MKKLGISIRGDAPFRRFRSNLTFLITCRPSVIFAYLLYCNIIDLLIAVQGLLLNVR
jgi:hypothetical protein